MARLKLTKRTVESLKVREKDHIAFDVELPGFGVRVMPSGKRFFLIQYRRHGRTRRVMIGQFGPVTAENARREATRSCTYRPCTLIRSDSLDGPKHHRLSQTKGRWDLPQGL